MNLAIACLLALAVSYGVCRLVMKRGSIAEVTARSNHKSPTPQGGGAAILIGLLAGLIVTPGFWPDEPQGRVLLVALDAMALLGFISWHNDRKEIRARYRLLAQGLCVGGVAAYAISRFMGQADIPFLALAAGWAVTTLAWMWFVNLYNFMDGIDGILGVETLSIAGGIVLLSVIKGMPVPAYLLLLCAATLGFLLLNWPKAKLFAGDAGSIPLGFILGYALIGFAHLSPVSAVILPLYFIADASVTLMFRLWRREPFWQAHSGHFYQQAVRYKGFSHRRVTLTVAGLNLVLIALAVWALSQPVAALAVALLAVGAVMWHFKKP